MRKGFSEIIILIVSVLIVSAGIGAYMIQKEQRVILQPTRENKHATPTPYARQSFPPLPTVTQTPTSLATSCVVDGCSRELCIPENQRGSVASICIYKDEYACYETARCELQKNGACGWTQTPQLSACIAKGPHPSCPKAPSCSGQLLIGDSPSKCPKYICMPPATPTPTPTFCNPPIDCPAPPIGCNYQGSSTCSCGRLVCATPSPTPVITPTPSPITTPTPSPIASSAVEMRIEADDFGFYPAGQISFPAGTRVKLTFFVRTTNVYYGGLDFHSSKFSTIKALPGQTATVEFTADSSFVITSYWPSSGVYKASLSVNVQ